MYVILLGLCRTHTHTHQLLRINIFILARSIEYDFHGKFQSKQAHGWMNGYTKTDAQKKKKKKPNTKSPNKAKSSAPIQYVFSHCRD